MGKGAAEPGVLLQGNGVATAAEGWPGAETSDHLICGSAARILSLAWLLCIFTPAMDSVAGPFPSDQGFILRIAFLASIILGYLILRLFMGGVPNATRSRVLGVGALCLAPAATIGSLLAVPFPVMVMLWCISGGGMPVLLCWI